MGSRPFCATRLILCLTSLLVLAAPRGTEAQNVTAANGFVRSAQKPRVAEAYAYLPLSFEPSEGQTDPKVKFLSHGQGYTMYVSPTELLLTLRNPSRTPDPRSVSESDKAMNLAVLRVDLEGSNAEAQIQAADRLPGKSNYFIGNDPQRWRTNVLTYAKLTIRSVYPGVDLVYYGNQRQLEHDFIVSPGANPGAIRMGLVGAKKISLDAKGDLIVAIGEGQVRFQKPLVYQEVGGVRRQILGGYILMGKHEVGFRVSRYDASRPLIIDPVISYSTYLGGSGNDAAGLGGGPSIAVDSAGNAYVTGTTTSTNFPTTSGAFQTTLKDPICAFVTKLNPTGTQLVYSTYLGGTTRENGMGIAVDSSGDAFVTGTTYSTDFPTTSGAYQATYGGGSANAFVTELNPAGSGLVYSTYLGGSTSPGANEGNSIALDSTGDAYVAGFTDASNFPTTAGAFQTTYENAGGHAFVTELNPTGTALIYSTFLEGTDGVDGANSIALDSSGNAYVTGTTTSSDFPVTSGAFQTAYAGGPINTATSGDAFIAKVNAGGSTLGYATYLGGSNFDQAIGIAVDSLGNAYVTGSTASSDFPVTSGAFQTTYGGNTDGFVTKINPSGSALVYSTYLGGASFDDGLGIALDSGGNAYVTGGTSSSTFPATSCAFQAVYGGGAVNAFITTFSPSGVLLYSTYLGGTGNDFGSGIAVDSAGDTYITGGTSSTNFPTTTGAFQTTLGGAANAFVTLIPNPSMAPTITSANSTTFQVGVAGSFPVTTTGCPSPTVTESPALPSGVTFTAGALTGTPAAGTGGTYSITLTASNGVGANFVQDFTLTVDQGPAITSASTTTFTVGTAGSFAVVATGFPVPTITESGTLPSGVTFTAGVLTGTPAAGTGGTYSITLTASNGIGANFVQNFTLTVDQGPAITSASTTTFTVGIPGSFVVTATGFPAPTIAESGALPSGVTFSGGVLSGTPAPGSNQTYNITFTASNSAGAVTQNFTLVVATLEISPTSVNFGTLYWGQVAVQLVKLTNGGSVPITISSITVTPPGTALGDYADISTCTPFISSMPGTLPAGKSCTIAVVIVAALRVFSPTPSTATLTITDSTGASPQSISLTAQVINPQATLSANLLNFATETEYSTSAAKMVTLTNTGSTPLNITGISITGNFAFSSGTTCSTGTLNPSASCAFYITFTPESKGVLTGQVTITDNALTSPQVINLVGKGD